MLQRQKWQDLLLLLSNTCNFRLTANNQAWSVFNKKIVLKYKQGSFLLKLLSLTGLLLCSRLAFAQPTTLPGANRKDTAQSKTNTGKWKDEEAAIIYEQLNSSKKYIPDSTLHNFQRRPFMPAWERDMGNQGSPVNNLAFTPEYRVGPTLGYHIFDAYRFQPDSLRYYSTSRPYSVFTYMLGSKLEQMAGIMHTQNIRPNWNIMVEYRKVNSPGFYKIQRNNHDNFALSTNYKSLNKHYLLYGGMVYNKEQHDENGGIVNDSELNDLNYVDRRTVDVAYQNSQYSTSRSTVTNMQRDFGILLQQSYVWGPTDTTYNADSTGYTFQLKPRFSITHKLQLSTEKHVYKDLAPDSLHYLDLFVAPFSTSGSSYYVSGGDSVVTEQKWFWVDNKFMFNGFIGNDSNQLKFSAGAGNRYDEFISTPAYQVGTDRSKLISNYLTGEIRKELLKPGEWEYAARAIFYATGDYAGNFDLNAAIGKEFKKEIIGFKAGFQQLLGSAPFSYAHYENIYTDNTYQFKKESTTLLYATLTSRKYHFSGGVRNYILDNYIYIDQNRTPAQYNIAFNVSHVWVNKMFHLGNFIIDNELIYQQVVDNAPVNIPQLMGRHQFSYERAMFKRALKIATGVEVRYNSSYHPAGYDVQLNRFYYLNQFYVDNTPELSVFLNFRVKHFRAFIMADRVQQLFARNTILYLGNPTYNFFGTGTNYTSVYASPNFCLRFGFSWVMIN